MNVGELFVSLGIKGADETVGKIVGVEKGMKDVASVSLEAKAAIVGAMYALEQLFAVSGERGTALSNLSSLIGIPEKVIQQYDYAARRVGASNQEMEGTFKNLQSVMAKALLGKGAPAGIGRVAMLTGNITNADIEKFAKQPQLLIQRLQEYAAKETNQFLRNETLRTFGLTDGIIAALNKQVFKPEVFNKAPLYSDKEAESLNKSNIAWSDLGTKIEMAVGHFNALHGGQLVGDISKIVDKVLLLAEAFDRLAVKVHIFEGIGKVFEGWAAIFGGLLDVLHAVDILTSDNPKDQAERERLKMDIGQGMDVLFGSTPAVPKTAAEKEQQQKDFKESWFGAMAAFLLGKNVKLRDDSKPVPVEDASKPNAKMIAPPPPPKASASNNNFEINQSLNFQHEGKDAHKTADSVKTAVQRSVRQLASLGQVS